MKVFSFDDPWKHFIIDDVLNSSEFKRIQELSAQWIKPASVKSKMNVLLTDFKWHQETFQHRDEAEEVLFILNRTMNQLTEIFNLHSKYKSYFIEYVNCSTGYHYHIHNDAPTKIFSSVFFVSPKGDGTRLFKQRRTKPAKIVEWKENRMVCFARDENTWHDYCSSNDDRITFNLCHVSFNIPEKSRFTLKVGHNLTPIHETP